jgi:hypothetical protein
MIWPLSILIFLDFISDHHGQVRQRKIGDDGSVLLDLRKGADNVKWGSTLTVDSDLGGGSAQGNELLVNTQLLKERNHVWAHQQCRS